MKPLDKKQIPQVAAMAVLAVIFFGYFAFKMIMPTPAAAGTHAPAVPAAAEAPKPSAAATVIAATATDPASAQLAAPPPTVGLRDPFVQAISDQPAPPPAAPKPAAHPAALVKPMPVSVPDVPSLPGTGLGRKVVAGLGTMPVAIRPVAPLPPAALPLAPPTWVVTGLLQSGAEKVAILRSGEARRFVKQGDLVDATFRVAAVTGDAVVLKHGNSRFTLPLGGAKAVPTARTVAAPSTDGSTAAASVPDFTLNTLDGKAVSLSSYRGHVVVLDFWASWCGWCKKGMPQVQSLYNRFGPKGLVVLSINSWDKHDAMQAFVHANPQYTTTMLFDPSPAALSVAGNLFGARKIPATVVIDQKGRIADAFSGYSPVAGKRVESVLMRLGVNRTAPGIARAVKPRLRRTPASHPAPVAFAPLPALSLNPRRAAPEIACAAKPVLRRSHVARPTLVAFAPRSMFALTTSILALPPVSVPKTIRRAAHRQSIYPTVRVADYRSDQVGSLFPGQGHGLLPSGMDAPEFSLSTLGGQDVTLSQFQGTVVVLGFWASWDTGSMKMLTWLQNLQTQVGHDKLTVLAVNSWDNKSAMQAALQGGNWDLTLLFDPSVSNASVAVHDYHAPDVPAFYVIDPQGRIAGAFTGSGRNTTSNVKATLAKLGVL